MFEFSSSSILVQVDSEKGQLDLLRKTTKDPRFVNCFCSVTMGNRQKYTTLSHPVTITSGPYESLLGNGERFNLDFVDPAAECPVHFQLNLVRYEGHPFITLEAITTNISKEPLKITSLSPIAIDARQNGGLFVGRTPDDALIFENGFTYAEEFLLRSFPAREESDSQWMEYLYSKANGSQNVLCGVISKPDNICRVISNDQVHEGITSGDREGIGEWRAEMVFPFPKSLDPGDTLTSGVWVLMIDMPSGFEALETYANLIREYNHIQVWPHPVPHGWNSWCNPLGKDPGAYVHDITEKVILDNLAVAVKYLKPFGLHYWQLDDGWTAQRVMTVDEVEEGRFPHGLKAVADKIHAEGLRAGIWINPFNIGPQSRVFKEHEKDGWFPPPDPSFPLHSHLRSIDISHPGVQEYLRHFIRKVTKEWGFDILKVDFTYFVMAPSKFHNPRMTAAEVMRLGYHLIKQEAGPDVFVVGIGGPIGLHYGDADGERISLDTLPQWGEAHELGVTKNGIVVSYRTFARRYFYHNRVWLHHLDCLCFRPPLQWNESLCLATAMGLLGGIFKVAEKFVNLQPEAFQVVQKMLPIYRQGARPLDLFRTLTPEILHLPITKPFLQWHVVALFNWGVNRNLLTGENQPEGEKAILLDFTEMGLEPRVTCHVFDFWAEKYLGTFTDSYTTTLEPHHEQLLALHPVTDPARPQFLSSNRHVTQGAVEIHRLLWDPATLTLSGIIHAVQGFEHHLYFHVPPPFQLLKAHVRGKDKISTTLTGECLQARIQLASNTDSELVEWKLTFKK